MYKQKNRQRINMQEYNYTPNNSLNTPISFEEVKKFIRNLKNRKSTVIDQIPNEALNKPDVILMLHALFSKCFQTCVLPLVWLKAIITPVPKVQVKIHMFHLIIEVLVYCHV